MAVKELVINYLYIIAYLCKFVNNILPLLLAFILYDVCFFQFNITS